MELPCPVCGSDAPEPVLMLRALPVLPNAPHDSAAAARATGTGDVDLVVCTSCAHLYNRAFDEAALAYSDAYDNSLYFSATFRNYAEDLVERLVHDHDLGGKLIVEIGSGSGDFLALLCDRAAAQGFGFDPSHDPERLEVARSQRVTLHATPYPVDGSVRPEFVVSQHVLEHLPEPSSTLRSITETCLDGAGAYHEVPDGSFMLRETALWDLIYEHLSYFTDTSIEHLAHAAGLRITARGSSFGDQYAWFEATPGDTPAPDPAAVERGVADAVAFGRAAERLISLSREKLDAAEAKGPVALWGAGSKGISYLNIIAGADRIDAVVDVNPRKVGSHVAGTGHVIVDPAELRDVRPETVMLANPIYIEEVAAQLAQLHPTAGIDTLW